MLLYSSLRVQYSNSTQKKPLLRNTEFWPKYWQLLNNASSPTRASVHYVPVTTPGHSTSSSVFLILFQGIFPSIVPAARASTTQPLPSIHPWGCKGNDLRRRLIPRGFRSASKAVPIHPGGCGFPGCSGRSACGGRRLDAPSAESLFLFNATRRLRRRNGLRPVHRTWRRRIGRIWIRAAICWGSRCM